MTRKRLKKVIGKMALALSSAMEDGSSPSREAVADIKARVSSATHKDDRTLGAHYMADVQLLLDEVERLSYEMVDRTDHDP